MDGGPHQSDVIQLGLRLIKGLSKRGAEQLLDARRNGHFVSILDVKRRGKLGKDDLEALSAADALRTLTGNRHKTHWAIMAAKDSRPLLPETHTPDPNDSTVIKAPSVTENVIFDYQSTGLTLRIQTSF